MMRYTLSQLEAAFPRDPVARPTQASNIVSLEGRRPAVFDQPSRFPDMNAAAQAGLPRIDFESLPGDRQNAMLAAMLAFPPIRKRADVERQGWLPVLFACCDAERLGATEARNLALAWCQISSRFKDETDFDRDWKSFRTKGISVGTLIDLARQAGFDVGSWLWPSQAGVVVPVPTVVNSSNLSTGSFFSPVPFAPADLHPVPWVVDGLLVAGDLTVLAGQGGGAKTAAAISLCVALAAGSKQWGPYKIRPHPEEAPRRVSFISGEEDRNRLGLLIAAASQAQKLSSADCAKVEANLVAHDGRASGWCLGGPRAGVREDIAPEEEDINRDMLRDSLRKFRPDVLVLDTFAALIAAPNENDNTVITRLMGRLGRVMREVNCSGLLVHHAPKMTREAAAAQSGEATLVRGGSAIVNSARVAVTLTGLTSKDATAFMLSGAKPDAVRCLETVKINDRKPPPPAYLNVIEKMVTVRDGNAYGTRAVEFLSAPGTSGGPQVSPKLLNTAMHAIDAGVVIGGTKMPLSPGGGRSNDRDGILHIGHALRAADPKLNKQDVKPLACEVLRHLKDQIRCVAVQDVTIPRQAGGKPNGTKSVKGLVCCWNQASWVSPSAALANCAGVPVNTPDKST